MGEIGKSLKVSAAALAGIVILGLVVVYSLDLKRPPRIEEASETNSYRWYREDLGEQARSSDGSDFHLLIKKGDSNNWIVFFSGGGASWDESSAAQPIKIMNFLTGKPTGNYFANIPIYLKAILQGMTDNHKADNPFKDWNIVYIPYSTGDLHIGNRVAEYVKDDGSRFIMRYNGRNNVRQSLEWIYANVDSPDKLLIAGESAGGFGSAFWAGEIANRYPHAQIYQYSDSAFLYSEKWPNIVNKEWQAEFESTFGYPVKEDLIGAAFEGNGSRMPSRTVFLQSYSLYDEVLITFQNAINDSDSPIDAQAVRDWSRQLRESVAFLADTMPNYHYFLTDYGMDIEKGTTGHTFATRDTFYKAEQDGIKLLTWLDDIINRGQSYSVGERFVEELREARE
ncbi:pectin acetylesterase-family hydrolase [Cohnella boryungensis]|uniref:Pectin acetylesterase-family hydrolase n=1 Tax=Cohnella boryungensis TaxID=768479 RepID=A0ABV8S8M3_9BACL